MKRIVIYASILLLLSSCGSKKKVSHDANYVRHEDVYYTQKDKQEEEPPKPFKPSKTTKPSKQTDLTKSLEKEARSWLGTPYRYGGETRKGTDCSGLVMSVYRDVAGIKLPRSSREMQAECQPIKTSQLRKGDLVFFSSSKRGRVTHVGLYLENGNFIHASSSRGVIISNLDEDYYARHFHSAGRVIGTSNESEMTIIDELAFTEATQPSHVVVRETIVVVERIIDTVYIPSPERPQDDSIRSRVRSAMSF